MYLVMSYDHREVLACADTKSHVSVCGNAGAGICYY